MFSVFYRQPLSSAEKISLKKRMRFFEQAMKKPENRDKLPLVGYEHLQTVLENFHEVNVMWNTSFDLENGWHGAFRWYFPNTIELSTIYRYGDNDILFDVVPIVVHELWHRVQFKKWPDWYLFCLFPGLRHKIERETDNLEFLAQSLIK